MADPENIGIAVGIALLLSVETEIIILLYVSTSGFKAATLNLPRVFIRESVQENINEFAVS